MSAPMLDGTERAVLKAVAEALKKIALTYHDAGCRCRVCCIWALTTNTFEHGAADCGYWLETFAANHPIKRSAEKEAS